MRKPQVEGRKKRNKDMRGNKGGRGREAEGGEDVSSGPQHVYGF